MEAERFVEEVVVRRFRPTHIVEGPSFGFGRGRKGTAELLRRVASRFDCEVHVLEPVTLQVDQGETLLVSSSLIRRLLEEGKVRRAGLCMGRPYALTGKVVEGDRRGRVLGFPTANLAPSDQLVPGDGVYAGRAAVGDESYLAAISIGDTPTFGGARKLFEAHLLDFDGDLYGETMQIKFGRLLRRQRAFDSAEALVEQMRRDISDVRTDAHTRGPGSHGRKAGP
jgi:riboflavin kinase/FMN adenylyltransferase